MTVDRVGRRRLLTLLGTGAALGLAGCGAVSDSDPDYEEGDADPPADATERTPEESTAAEGLAEQEAREDSAPLDSLSLVEHGFVFEDGFRGSTVQGTVENEGDGRIEHAEVRVRVYNDEGAMIGRYLDSVGDLEGGTDWEFTAVLLESPEDVASYDIAVVGLSA
jgi:hypothetical protein